MPCGPLARASLVHMVLLAALCLPAAAHAAALEPCASPSGSLCTTVDVPLDRDSAGSGTIGLAVELRHGGIPGAAPLVAIAGGPGQSSIAAGDALEQLTRPLGRGRDLVLVDLRGTGRSDALVCPELQRRESAAAVRACARRLGARRGLYRTRDSVADIEAVRVALGAPRIALFGVSYGTRTAIGYARANPERVERLVLDSPVAEPRPDPFLGPQQRALPRILGQATVADLRAVVRQRPRDAALLQVLFATDIDPSVRRALPAAVRAARAGWPQELRRLERRVMHAGGSVPARRDSAGLNAANQCEELPREPLAALGPGPFDATTRRLGPVAVLCRAWPRTARPEPAPLASPLQVPTLVLTGAIDVRTPWEGTRAITGPAVTRLLVPATGHSVLGTERGVCASRALRAFARGEAVRSCPPARLAPAWPALPTRPARPGPEAVLKAVGIALDDVDRALRTSGSRFPAPPRGRGPRGGAYRIGADGSIALRSYAAVPGVGLSGLISSTGAGRLRIGGPAQGTATLAPDGRLRVRVGTRSLVRRWIPPR